MSLKAFHLVFVGASVILAFSFTAWSIDAYASRDGGETLLLGVLSALFGAGLVVYGVRVRAKLKSMGAR